MFELINWGETFMETLAEVGDWLLYTPTQWVIPLSQITGGSISDIVFSNPFGSIGSSLLGAGLIGILAYKVVIFVTDLIN